MAKTPDTPKGKTGAPAQFDMNSRERKGGGKGGRGGPGRGRDEKRAPSHLISLPPAEISEAATDPVEETVAPEAPAGEA